MRYATAGALRAAIEHRLVQQSNESGIDIARLRRRVVFERLLVRFAAGQAWEQTSGRSTEGTPGKGGVWVLKGGAALEFRLADRARATKDVDVEMRHSELAHEEIRDLFVETLLADPDGVDKGSVHRVIHLHRWCGYRLSRASRDLRRRECGRPC